MKVFDCSGKLKKVIPPQKVKEKFWTDFIIGLAGPAAWNRDMRNKEIVYKLQDIKAFVAATHQITRSEVDQQWATDTLRKVEELIRMHSHDN